MSINVKIVAQYEEFISASKALQQSFAGVMDGMKSELKVMSDEAKVSMKGHESATEQFANILKSNMKGVTGAVEGVKIAWAQLAVIFEAGNFLKDAVRDTIKMTTEAQALGRTLGISATKASYLKVAIEDSYGSTKQFELMAKGLDQQLKTNEKSMKAFGLETRDAGGHLKDQQTLIMDALEVLRGYKEGTDRNIAAQKLFGRGVEVSSEMLSLNAEKLAAAKEKADALGLAVGTDDVEASNKFRAAMNDVGNIIDAVKKAIGSALLPVLDDLAEWFTSYGPQALMAIKASIDIVISLFKGFALVVKVVWELVTLAFRNMATAATGFGSVITAVLHGDFGAAKDAATTMMSTMATDIGGSFQSIMSSASATGDSITGMWSKLAGGKPVKDSGVSGGGTEDADISKDSKGHKHKDNSAAEARKAAAEKRRLIKEEYDAKMEAFKGEEQAAKENLSQILVIQKKELASAVAMYGAKSKQAESAANRIAETEIKIAEQSERLDLMRSESHRRMQMALIAADEQASQQSQQLGDITYQELIRKEKEYENQRYQLQMQGLVEEAAANLQRVEEHQRTLLAIEELDAAHQGRLTALQLQAKVEQSQSSRQIAGIMQSSFATAIAGMINKTMTFKQAMKSMFSSILQGLVQMLAQWAAKQLAHYILDRVMHAANQKAKNAVERTAATSTISTAAAIAGAQGTASFAGAPWPVDIGAPGFGLAMASAAGAFGAGLAAEQGYDVPAGVNPVTQLHQKEMVLPAAQADVIRGMADGGGMGGGDHHYHVNAMDSQSILETLRRNPSALGKAMEHAARMGHVRGAA
jgi:hypothetical protein